LNAGHFSVKQKRYAVFGRVFKSLQLFGEEKLRRGKYFGCGVVYAANIYRLSVHVYGIKLAGQWSNSVFTHYFNHLIGFAAHIFVVARDIVCRIFSPQGR